LYVAAAPGARKLVHACSSRDWTHRDANADPRQYDERGGNH